MRLDSRPREGGPNEVPAAATVGTCPAARRPIARNRGPVVERRGLAQRGLLLMPLNELDRCLDSAQVVDGDVQENATHDRSLSSVARASSDSPTPQTGTRPRL